MGISRRRTIALVSMLAIASTGLVACGRSAAAAPPVVLSASEAALAPAGPTLSVQRGGGLLGWLASTPAQPARGEANLDLYLVDAAGQPVTDATITLDTDMTNMSHGPNLVKAEPTVNGHYAGRVRFQMPGPWRVIAVVERPGLETVRLRFQFSVNLR